MPVTSLKGIGQSRQQSLARLGIESVWDLLLHFPFRYEDRSTITPIGSLQSEQKTLIQGLIDSRSTTRGRNPRFDCHVSDDSGSIVLRFFNHYPGQQQRFASGQQIRCYGRISYGQDGLELIHPECEIISATSEFNQLPKHLSPIYPLAQGLTQQLIGHSVEEAFALLSEYTDQVVEWLKFAPATFQHLCLYNALFEMHFPDIDTVAKSLGPELNDFSSHPARKRLALEELLVHSQLAKHQADARQFPAICNANRAKTDLIIAGFLNSLAFKPTTAQNQAIEVILADLSNDYAMRRLLQGDVGSGKTLVAACAALAVLQTGTQVALLAPTELLAEQHFLSFQTWFSELDAISINVVLVKGGQTRSVREDLIDEIQSGAANLIIGTHAILQESIRFKALGLIVIDEQHRFGVEQRAALARKNLLPHQHPHQLIMTATPIPRTLALLQYAEVDVTQLNELPAGRIPVTTVALSKQRRHEVIQRIDDWVSQGKQVYWVCTVIEDNHKSSREALQVIHATLCSELPQLRIVLLHGKMSAQEKQTIMSRFREHQYDVLVATTVIEVGVDVSNANLIIIEDADQLGLAQLHQLRGRVGRGHENGYCVLLYQTPLSDIARQRLGLLRECNDGFVIAEKDLQLRGPGEMAGLRQSGSICFRAADLVNDQDLLELSQTILEQMSNENLQLSSELQYRWIKNTAINPSKLEV